MNVAEQKSLMKEMDQCAYDMAGFLLALVRLHDDGTIKLPLPPGAWDRMRPAIKRFQELHAAYRAVNAIDKARDVKLTCHAPGCRKQWPREMFGDTPTDKRICPHCGCRGSVWI